MSLWVQYGLTFLLLLSLPAGRPVLAANPGMSTSMGFGGYVVSGRWVPLRIVVSGASAWARIEIVRTDETGAVSGVESYPCQARGYETRIEAPIYTEEGGSAVRVSLTEGGRLLAREKLDTSAKIFPGHLVIAIGIPAQMQQAISRALLPSEPIVAVDTVISELPGSALCYDGVSGLVLADPGPVLNPSQLRALRAWVAGGGQLVIYGVRDQQDSILGSLGLARDEPVGARRDISLGLGRVMILQDTTAAAALEQPAAWRDMMNLRPFAKTSYLSMTNCFPSSIKVSPAEPANPVSGRIWVMIIIWMAIAASISLAVRRWKLTLLLLVTLSGAVLAAPMGGWLSRIWQRGALTRTHAVILPADGGLLIKTDLKLPPSDAEKTAPLDDYGHAGSPWGVNMKYGMFERGGFYPSRSIQRLWRHDVAKYVLNLGPSAKNSITLFGYLPGPAGKMPSQTPAVLWDGGNWLADAGGSWKAMREYADWFMEDREWLNRLTTLIPGYAWLFGHGAYPGLDLSVEGAGMQELTWAMPVAKGG